VCNADSCCPVDFVFDTLAKDCVCAKDACCPPNHKYSPTVRACVCIGDACCPTGYKKDTDMERCVCISDAACGANNVCDAVTGACKCLNDMGCKAGNFCNALGFCQSIAACTSNADCPTAYFCDITNNQCVPGGPCTLDEHCPLDQICNATTAACKPGCRKDGDCAGKKTCNNGTCSVFCRDNSYCAVNQFCNKTSGVCAAVATRPDCKSCGADPTTCNFGSAGSPTFIEGHCLGFVSEGTTMRFCGLDCATNDQCPAGFDCGGVIFDCSNALSSCEAVAGETITCNSYLVENEDGPQKFCADSSGNPHEYFKACAPSSGFCPATTAP